MKRTLFILLAFVFATAILQAQKDYSDSEITRLILLGTGTPNPSPAHSGPSVAIVVNDEPYIIDFGPGLIRKAAAMSERYGGKIKGLDVKKIKHAFLTHLHSDHTTGYPDLILTPWVMGRDEPLEVYGPEGLNNMTEHILKAYEDDIKYRLYGLEPANNRGWRVNSHEFSKEGVVYEDENVKVEAFPVPHGSWPNAWGYRFTTPDKIIVISGDTSPSEKMIEYAKGADILVHEVYSQAKFDSLSDFWKTYHKQNHTSTVELAKIASAAQPGLLVLYHILFWGATEKEIYDEITEKYKGRVIVGHDLDTF
ncbi:MAG: MBL fold metallo-hydrolase [Chlorobi bacterium]|nr:MBL fold metallo-hydrolase [Chlorobiota bacterium]